MAKIGAAAALQKQFESVLGGHLDWQSRPLPERIPTGISEVDAAIGGLPRGCLTEIVGQASSGRTSLLLAILAHATARGEICALVDAEDAFDPTSASSAGVNLDRLLWVRCSHNAEHALKAADLLIQGGGFGVVVMDLGDTRVETARRISLTSWFRLRRAVEHTPTILLALARQSNAKTCASITLECRRERSLWTACQGPGAGGQGPGSSSWWGPRLLSERTSPTSNPQHPRIAMANPRPPAPGPWPQLFRGIAVRVTSRQRSKICSSAFTAGAI